MVGAFRLLIDLTMSLIIDDFVVFFHFCNHFPLYFRKRGGLNVYVFAEI